jgi:hypothetical protein
MPSTKQSKPAHKGKTTAPSKPSRTTVAKPVGRPTSYTKEVADLICGRMANGELLAAILREPGIPSRSTIWRLAEANREFRNAYAHARELQADAIAESVVVIADDDEGDVVETAEGKRSVDYENIQRSRLRADARKWLAAKISPRWRDKTGLEVSNPPGQPFEVQSSQPLTPPEVVEAVGRMMTEAEEVVGLPPRYALPSAERLKRILASGESVPPSLYAAIIQNTGKLDGN